MTMHERLEPGRMHPLRITTDDRWAAVEFTRRRPGHQAEVWRVPFIGWAVVATADATMAEVRTRLTAVVLNVEAGEPRPLLVENVAQAAKRQERGATVQWRLVSTAEVAPGPSPAAVPR